MRCEAELPTVANFGKVPLCRSLHKGTYAEDPVMYRCWYQATVWRVNAGGWT